MKNLRLIHGNLRFKKNELLEVAYILVAEDFALFEESNCVAVAVLGHEGEEVGGLGAGGEVEGVAAVAVGGQLNLLCAAHDVGEVGGGDGLLARVLHVHALAEGVGVGHKGIAVLGHNDAHASRAASSTIASSIDIAVWCHKGSIDISGNECRAVAGWVYDGV